MDPFDLPAELADLERELLAAREPVRPSLEFSVRARVRHALARERQSQRWAFAVAAAALLLVGMRLFWPASASNVDPAAAPVDHVQLAEVAERIATLLPELPAAEAERQARLFLMSGGGGRSLRGRAAPLPRPFALTTQLD
jgi:hypothetical protein